MITGSISITKLTPDTGMHLKNIKNGHIYEGVIFLGVNDSSSNYTEVTEQEYQAYLEEISKNIDKYNVY